MVDTDKAVLGFINKHNFMNAVNQREIAKLLLSNDCV